MPTGYTHKVQEGKIATLRDFALTCARGMGALVMMRDDPMDAPVPKRFEPETKYSDERIAEAQKLLAELPSLSLDECDARAKAQFDEAMASHTTFETNKALHKQRYQDMLFRVERWEAPEEISSLKSFMVEQLNESIRFDCGDYSPKVPERLTGERWREQMLASASRDLAYHTVDREKEIQRTKSRNEWLDALWRSLPKQEVA